MDKNGLTFKNKHLCGLYLLLVVFLSLSIASSICTPKTDKRPSGKEKTLVKDITSKVIWGYRPANRTKDSIDIIVAHSNYHVVDQAKQLFDFDVDGCIEQFKGSGTSAHYMIARDGTILRMVNEKDVAYHAGASALPDGSRKMLNTQSIGIEVISMKKIG